MDFVVKEGRQAAQLIQVCWDLSRKETREREMRALLRASAAILRQSPCPYGRGAR